MNHVKGILGVAAAILAVVVSGCSGRTETPEGRDSEALSATRAEHDREGGEVDEANSGEGEEPGTELALDATYDEVRNGARLILAYDAASNAFSGTVENTTDETLARVRVEVHLSNGTELGPTTSADLGPGEVREVALSAASGEFEGWSAHAEVGNEEHDDEAEGAEGETHDREGRGEHRSR